MASVSHTLGLFPTRRFPVFLRPSTQVCCPWLAQRLQLVAARRLPAQRIEATSRSDRDRGKGPSGPASGSAIIGSGKGLSQPASESAITGDEFENDIQSLKSAFENDIESLKSAFGERPSMQKYFASAELLAGEFQGQTIEVQGLVAAARVFLQTSTEVLLEVAQADECTAETEECRRELQTCQNDRYESRSLNLLLEVHVKNLQMRVAWLTDDNRHLRAWMAGLDMKIAGLDMKIAGLDMKIAGLEAKERVRADLNLCADWIHDFQDMVALSLHVGGIEDLMSRLKLEDVSTIKAFKEFLDKYQLTFQSWDVSTQLRRRRNDGSHELDKVTVENVAEFAKRDWERIKKMNHLNQEQRDAMKDVLRITELLHKKLLARLNWQKRFM